MTSTRKAASPKRANVPRPSDYTNEFAKDWERLTRSGWYNMRQLKEVMLLLISNDSPLDAEWRDHERVGDLADHRECHIRPRERRPPLFPSAGKAPPAKPIT